MKKLILQILLLFALTSFGQTPDATIKTNTNNWIRTAPIITGANEATLFDELTNSKISRLEGYTAGGTNTYTVAIGWVTSYQTNLNVIIKFTNANTGAATININGLGAKAIKKSASSALISGDIIAGQIIKLVYDGTNFQIVGGGGSGGGTWGGITGTLSDQTDLQTALNAKQATLVSGANIKTVNGTSLLGSGDLTTTSTFTGLTDGPGSFTGKALNYNRVNAGETAEEYRSPSQVLSDIGGENALTFSTGLTRSTNTITVNTSQNIAKLSNLTSNGFVKTSGGDGTLSIDSSTYLTGNQSITLSGDVTGSGATSITTTLATVNSNVGTFGSATKSTTVTSNGKGLITSISEQTVTPAVGSITGLGSNVSTFLATPSSANLASALTDETGTGVAVFGTSPSITTPAVVSTINRQTASYTFALTDIGKTIEMNVGSANNLTIPPNSSVAFPLYITLVATQYGAGTTTLVAGSGVTFRNASGTLNFAKQYAGLSALKIGTDEWYIFNTTNQLSNPMTTLGDILYEDATPAPQRLAGNTTTAPKYIRQVGTGSVSAAPSWENVNGSEIQGVADNSSATTGYLGENLEGIQSTYTNYTTSATYQNITSTTLTSGTWLVSGSCTFSTNSATLTGTANAIFTISTTTASASGTTEAKSIIYLNEGLLSGNAAKATTTFVPFIVKIPTATSTVYYVNSQSTFTVGNPQVVCSIEPFRIR